MHDKLQPIFEIGFEKKNRMGFQVGFFNNNNNKKQSKKQQKNIYCNDTLTNIFLEIYSLTKNAKIKMTSRDIIEAIMI